jgi:DNA-binding MarR family transcriptional regulator
MKAAQVATQAARASALIDLDRYVPGYLTWISNKLSGGASQAYLTAFGTGIETWRLLVLLAIERTLSAQHACRVIGMDKASASRAFKRMQADGLITMGLDPHDGRLRLASITAKGQALHDEIRELALERERALLSPLSPEERAALLDLLRRLHDNLPAVEEATKRYLQQRHPHALRKRAARPGANKDRP